MPARTDPDTDADIADLEKLATEVAALGYQTDLRTPDDRLPYLDVRNPQATILREKVYAQAGAFWFSWAEKIADSDDVPHAAGVLARVLRTVDAD
jgi:hypothetical protein